MRERSNTHTVQVGDVTIGGCAPIVIQSMTDTQTADVDATMAQITDLVHAGSEMVRVTVDTEESARAIPEIRRRMTDEDVDVPLIGDFHYIGHKLLAQVPECAASLDKYRVNPGNVGFGSAKDERFETFIKIAVDNNKPVRIGVNGGSLDEALLSRLMDRNARSTEPVSAREVTHEAMVQSALQSAEQAEEIGLPADHIILSAKVSQVQDLVDVNTLLAERSQYALHLGLTEAGMGMKGMVASTAGIGILLQQGIGDTIRVSLTPEPNGSRTREVHVAQQILQSLEIRRFMPQVTACPGCGRTASNAFQVLAREVQDFLEKSMPEWRPLYPGVESMQVAVMGCIVNGPGESRHANIGISLPGKKEDPRAPVYIDGKQAALLEGKDISAKYLQMIQDYVEQTYGPDSAA
jgi:(E)-4-hydroxy-3-methylbut-2-enyl-diphosphate synthase